MERITWDAADKKAVAEESFRIRQSMASISDLDCVRQAIKNVLPVERQRSIRQMNNVPFIHGAWTVLTKGEQLKFENYAGEEDSFDAFWKRLRDAAFKAGHTNPVSFGVQVCGVANQTLYNSRADRRIPSGRTLERLAKGAGVSVDWLLGRDEGQQAPEPKPAPVMQLVQPVQPKPAPVVQPDYSAHQQWPQAITPVISPQHELHFEKKASLEDLTTEMLATELVSRLLKAVDTSTLKKMIRDEVNAVLEQRLPGILPPMEEQAEAEPAPEERVRLPKVCVFGLMSGQKEMLKREYKGKVDFHFMEGSEGRTRIKNTVELMDISIATNWATRLPSMKGTPNFTNADGMTSIRNIIAGRLGIKLTKMA
jgi:hypothetical protein